MYATCTPACPKHYRVFGVLTPPAEFAQLAWYSPKSFLAMLGRSVHAYRRTFFERPRCSRGPAADRQAGWPVSRNHLGLLLGAVGLTLAAAFMRAIYLDHPMRYDESMAYFLFAVLPLRELATNYVDVQNHIFHTIVQHELLRWLPNTPAVIRLPAFLAGTALVPLSIALGFLLTRRSLYALMAGGLVAVSSILIEYATNGRGYSMVCAATLGMCICTIRLIEQPGRRRLWLVWAALGALGAFTIPIMIFPVAGLAAVVALDAALRKRPRRRRTQCLRLITTLATTGLLTFLLYLPALVRTGYASLASAGQHVRTFSRDTFGTYTQVAELTWDHWTRDVSILALVVTVIGLAGCLVKAVRTRNAIWAMPGVMLITALIVAAPLPLTPYPRVWLYMLPVVLTFGVCGLATLARTGWRGIGAAAMIVGIVLTGQQAPRREYLIAEDPHTLVDAEDISLLFSQMPPRAYALVVRPRTYAIRYYALTQHYFEATLPEFPQTREAYVVVNDTQSLEEVVKAKRFYLRGYGQPEFFRDFPHSTIYRLTRESPARIVLKHQ